MPLCIQCALSQSRPPTEIIIVDGSPYWQKTQQSILETFAHQAPNIQWTYVEAEKRGLTLQRNQAIQLARTDIVFLIDDDSLMYPTCAEDVMKIYELDSQSMIQGVQPAAAHAPPPGVVIDDKPKETGMNTDVKSLRHGRFRKLKHFLWTHIFLMSSEHLFVPYTGSFPTQSFPTLPENQVSIFPVKLFQGFRMTYRRETIANVKFEPALLYYAAGEDLDASYRVSLHGALVEAP
ncbi:MAG: glycosyltransferase, partial [Leptolyngbya sp. DLM2.Bin15]